VGGGRRRGGVVGLGTVRRLEVRLRSKMGSVVVLVELFVRVQEGVTRVVRVETSGPGKLGCASYCINLSYEDESS
jgi:hypothetical protein